MTDPRVTTRHYAARAEAEMAAEHPGWRAYAYEAAHNGVIVTGAVPVGIITRGPREGAPVWGDANDPTTRRIIVDPKAIVAELLALEAETGDCADCDSGGKEVRRVGPDGVEYGPCRRCNGSGLSPLSPREIPTTPPAR
jgi:hypothetical protein